MKCQVQILMKYFLKKILMHDTCISPVSYMTSEVNITDPLNPSLLHHHDNTDIGNVTSVPEIHWVRWVDILVGSVGLTIGLYSLIVNIIILAVLIRMSRR